MQDRQTTLLGTYELLRDVNDFEVKAFFTFDGAECEVINVRRNDVHKLGLVLHIGFLHMSDHLLYTFRMAPAALWHYLDKELDTVTPDVASLHTLYGREKALFNYQQVACTALGFRWMP